MDKKTKTATLHLICGLPCTGKTTLARRLEHDLPALYLAPDHWHIHLFGMDADHPEHDTRHGSVEALQWEVAERALLLGMDVILDNGFWSRSEREEYRAKAERAGAASQLYYLDATYETLRERLRVRNADLPSDTFNVMPEMLQEWSLIFEPPNAEELTLRQAPNLSAKSRFSLKAK